MKPNLEIMIEESKAAELIKQGKARYHHADFWYSSSIWLNVIKYNNNWYSLEKLNINGEVKNYFVNMDIMKKLIKHIVLEDTITYYYNPN